MAFFSYVFGPKLYMEYTVGNSQKMYEPTGLERFGDQILSTLSFMWNISYYSSPLLMTFLYRRGYLVTDSISYFAKFTTSLGLIVVISLCMRGFGRSQSRSYAKFAKALELAKSVKTKDEGKEALRKFDFEFTEWPVDYAVSGKAGTTHAQRFAHTQDSQRGFRFARLPCDVAAYVAIKTFGIRLIFPGSMGLLQSYMRPMLLAGRAKLIEEDEALRYKVKTIDKNEIDTIFVDNRARGSTNGKTLVICSEGNAGFYEIGIMSTPLELQYSVLGWNHPGFEGSTGRPYPSQDNNAIDAVVQLAIEKLGFAIEDIIFYGWSIGGYSSMWAALSYPDAKGVVLDATFDDILYLAQPRMPASLSGVVRIAIRDYCNINNLELMSKYQGPIFFVRRTEDEIIAENNQLETNRGNYLVMALLRQRYPHIFKTEQLDRLEQQLTKPIDVDNFDKSEDQLCMSYLITYASDMGNSFPMLIGEDFSDSTRTKLADFLLRKHFRDFNSTHCTPLPAKYFSIPWHIPTEKGFVFT